MRLVQVPTSAGRHPAKSKSKWRARASVLVIVIIVVESIIYFRPLPAAQMQITLPTPPQPSPPSLAWPQIGQAALTVQGYQFLATNAAPQSVATASMAKVITALCVLERKPIAPGENGPVLTMTQQDVELYNTYASEGGSVVPIVVGETMTEKQALEAMMLPSANNIADTLASWAFGSFSAYKSYATDFLARHNLQATHIGSDASGFATDTVSTTADLTALGKLALQNPTLMAIAGEKQATLTTAGTIYTTDGALGDGVITGLKTGNNDGDNGAFLYTGRIVLPNGAVKTVVGSIVNDTSAPQAVSDAVQLAKSAVNNFAITSIPRHVTVGKITTAWGQETALVTTGDIDLLYWKANHVYYYDTSQKTDGIDSTVVATLHAKTDGAATSTTIRVKTPLSGPTTWWRLTHFR